MIESTVLLLTFTDQYRWGASGRNGIILNCSTDVDDDYYGSLCQVFRRVIRYDIYKGANRGGICAANREIIEIAQTYLPKYVFYPCNFSGIVTEATLIEFRKMGCIVVADFFDDDLLFEPFSMWMVSCLDYVITHVPTLVERYEKLGFRCLFTPNIPMNPAILRKLDNQDKLYNATFIGSLYPYRRDYIEDIAASGAIINYLGGGNENKIQSATMVKIFNQSRINLNFSSGLADRSIIVGRVFEVPLCGGFLLTQYFPDLEQQFDIGREIECFKTPQEAAEKIQYYLKHPDECEEIAARGYERAQRDYTGPVVLSKVFREIEDDLCKRGRPKLIPPVSAVNTLRKADADKYYRWVNFFLESPMPMRDAWRETAELVLATNPEHQGAKRLLQRAKKWGDAQLFSGRLKLMKWFFYRTLCSMYALARSLAPRWVKKVIRKLRGYPPKPGQS